MHTDDVGKIESGSPEPGKLLQSHFHRIDFGEVKPDMWVRQAAVYRLRPDSPLGRYVGSPLGRILNKSCRVIVSDTAQLHQCDVLIPKKLRSVIVCYALQSPFELHQIVIPSHSPCFVQSLPSDVAQTLSGQIFMVTV